MSEESKEVKSAEERFKELGGEVKGGTKRGFGSLLVGGEGKKSVSAVLSIVVSALLAITLAAVMVTSIAPSKADVENLGTEVDSLASEVATLTTDIGAVESSLAGKASTTSVTNLAADLTALTATVDALESPDLTSLEASIAALEDRIEALEVGGENGTALSLTPVSTLPTIVNDGKYDFTVRVTNSALTPETGMIMLQLHAYSGSCAITSITMSGLPSFTAPDYDPSQSVCETVTIFSEDVVIGAGDSRIYQFSMTLDQGGVAFEWVPTLSMVD